jgi:hypothetical protein
VGERKIERCPAFLREFFNPTNFFPLSYVGQHFFFTYLARTTQDKIMKNKKFKNLAKTREMQK